MKRKGCCALLVLLWVRPGLRGLDGMWMCVGGVSAEAQKWLGAGEDTSAGRHPPKLEMEKQEELLPSSHASGIPLPPSALARLKKAEAILSSLEGPAQRQVSNRAECVPGPSPVTSRSHHAPIVLPELMGCRRQGCCQASVCKARTA